MTENNQIIVYHGTFIRWAIQMPEDGAILSPLEQKIKFLKRAKANGKQVGINELYKTYKASTIDDLALKIVSEEYGEHDIECRAKCVSFTRDFRHAYSYASRFEAYGGGVVLGLNIPQKYVREGVIFVPKQQSLDSLKEIILTPNANRDCKEIESAYSQYHPQILSLEDKMAVSN